VEGLVLRRLSEASRAPELESGEPMTDADAAAETADLPAGLDPKAGVDGLLRALTPGLGPVVCIGRGDLEAQIERSLAAAGAEEAPAPEGPGHERPELATAYTAPRTEVERALADVWQQALGISRIGIHDGFFELGGHSLLALRLVADLNRTFEVDLPVGQLFETGTVASLAQVVTERLSASVEQEELDRVLAEMEGLSDEEVEALLAEQEAVEEPMTEGDADG